MANEFKCPHCGFINIYDSFSGENTLNCVHCGNDFEVSTPIEPQNEHYEPLSKQKVNAATPLLSVIGAVLILGSITFGGPEWALFCCTGLLLIGIACVIRAIRS
jgi:hypothetical protein